jgi:hypothetical protein
VRERVRVRETERERDRWKRVGGKERRTREEEGGREE